LNNYILNYRTPLKYYPDAFYFPEIDTLLIRTKDDMDLVLSHIESVVFEFCKQNKIPQNNYIMHDASILSFVHPHLDWIITAEEIYDLSVDMYFLETGIVLLHPD